MQETTGRINLPEKAPRAFISYSWSSPDHEDWVLGLARDLMESGVDIVLDKWDLREGDEASAFMERMVTDSSVDKVIIISDPVYVEKSNSRAGGAGTEAQIISSKIFAQRDDRKFVVCVRENDKNGRPSVPAYYTSRIFVDFTDDSQRTNSFEQLLRWLFDKPLHKKPELGTAPHYITNDRSSIQMPTGAASRRAIDALTNGKSFAKGATQEYLQKFAAELERFRPPVRLDPAGDELMVYLDDFIPLRNEMLEVVRCICVYTHGDGYGPLLHSFFERVAEYFYPPESMSSYNEMDFDIFCFIGWEMYLHVCTTAFAHEQPDLFEAIVGTPYYCEGAVRRYGAQSALHSFDIFSRDIKILNARNERLQQRRLVPEADLIKARCADSPHDFDSIMQTDLILHMRAGIHGSSHWVPQTLVYRVSRWHGPFKAFMKARSRLQFERLMKYLSISNRKELDAFLIDVAQKKKWAPKWNWDQLDPAKLTDHENLCSLP